MPRNNPYKPWWDYVREGDSVLCVNPRRLRRKDGTHEKDAKLTHGKSYQVVDVCHGNRAMPPYERNETKWLDIWVTNDLGRPARYSSANFFFPWLQYLDR
jgi:hypothetical protein